MYVYRMLFLPFNTCTLLSPCSTLWFYGENSREGWVQYFHMLRSEKKVEMYTCPSLVAPSFYVFWSLTIRCTCAVSAVATGQILTQIHKAMHKNIQIYMNTYTNMNKIHAYIWTIYIHILIFALLMWYSCGFTVLQVLSLMKMPVTMAISITPSRCDLPWICNCLCNH